MEVVEYKESDTLSNLGEDLKAIENQGDVEHAAGLNEAREAVVATTRGVRESVYQFAASLDCYREFIKPERTWTTVLDRIARAQGCSAMTLHRMLKNYTDAKRKLPQMVINAMIELRIEPTDRKNRSVVEMAAQAPEPATREEAVATVKMAHAKVVAMKRTAKAETGPVKPGSLDDFTLRIVRMFESRYRSCPPSSRDDEVRYVLERVVNNLRANVRELHIYSRADQVRKPAAAKGKI